MKSVLPIVIAVCVIAATVKFISLKPASTVAADTSPTKEPAAPESDTLILSPQKQRAAHIELGQAELKSLQANTTVPGRLQYDDNFHIEVKASTSGILTNVLVLPSSVVKEGDVLAIVSSPEVGSARADVLRRKGEYDIAKRRMEWRSAACAGLRKLVTAVQAGNDPNTILDTLDATTLGTYREQVVSAYSRYRLAQSLAANIDQTTSGALSGRTVQERLSERDAARGALQATTEQSLFEACQASELAQLDEQDAERRLRISRKTVEMLLGYEDVNPSGTDDQTHSLSLVEVRAPISGTIESRTFSRQERVQLGDVLFVLANTSQLWVSADIREQQWSALRLHHGQTLKLSSPALPGETLTSTVEFVGREVNPTTNAVPLIATVMNKEDLLRPGQFVRVQLPIGTPREVIAVPESAVVEHDGQSFLFTPAGADTFQRVKVVTGLRQDDWVEIRSGLAAGTPVVVKGAFELKSEQLLEREE